MDKIIKVHKYNESYAQIEADANIIYELYDYFSFFVDGYQFNPKFKYGRWDGKIRLFQLNGKLPLGLVEQLHKFCSTYMYEVEIDEGVIDQDPITKEQFQQWVDKLEIYSGNTKISPYWYQVDAAFEAIKYKRRVLNLPTSAGKSLIQALITKYFLENKLGKVLIIVPKRGLVNQMMDDLCDYRLFSQKDLLGVMGGSEKDSDAMVYVSTWQSAKNQPKEWFKQFGALSIDECFSGDTKIDTPNGKVDIKDIKAGDLVYTLNETTHEIEIDTVVERYENMAISSCEDMYELEMDTGDVIHVTGNHKFLTKNRGWVRADELTELDDIIDGYEYENKL